MKDQYIVMAGCEYPAKPSFTENGIHDNLIDAESDAESYCETSMATLFGRVKYRHGFRS
jgi:hypothetical protein